MTPQKFNGIEDIYREHFKGFAHAILFVPDPKLYYKDQANYVELFDLADTTDTLYALITFYTSDNPDCWGPTHAHEFSVIDAEDASIDDPWGDWHGENK